MNSDNKLYMTWWINDFCSQVWYLFVLLQSDTSSRQSTKTDC